ncbi:MAG: flagellar assembly protein FliW [Candidatus Tectimicrobiota bacterium]
MDISRFGAGASDGALQIYMPAGLLGFPTSTHFQIVDPDPECPLKWLQAHDTSQLAFVITDPGLVQPDYHVELTPLDLMDVQAATPSTLFLLAIVTLPRGTRPYPTINLQGPLLVNRANGWAKQLVLVHEGYHTHHPLSVPPPVSA